MDTIAIGAPAEVEAQVHRPGQQPGLQAQQQPAQAGKPQCIAGEEIRFAVVMYGGVSLAIYINGITQELLHMVQATAPAEAAGIAPLVSDDEGDKLGGAQRIYRALGQCLQAWREGDQDVRDRLDDLGAEGKSVRDAAIEGLAGRDISSRFIVDILSGTSAGGINAIFLGKALANCQKIDGLKKLWVSEGDFGLLINDKASSEKPLTLTEPQTSLLNSQRMYRKLLEALDDMHAGEPPARSPLVEELDLFVTTTDLAGLVLPLKLSDGIVYEKRHRNVFHFRYAPSLSSCDEPSDFDRRNDPFLAYAARCTSSFPFAFEPMRLIDIDPVTSQFRHTKGNGTYRYRDAVSSNPGWAKFYSEYWRDSLIDLIELEKHGPDAELKDLDRDTLLKERADLKEAFRSRSFGDGGYLDNKPFSYATSMLMRRHANVPVYRKLVYIEPAPEHPEDEPMVHVRPDFARNVQAAVLDLPSKETIREDIERVLDRNAVIARISRYTKEVDLDVAQLMRAAAAATPLGVPEPEAIRFIQDFETVPLATMIRQRGVAYGGYHRLRVDEVSGMLSSLISRAVQHDPKSDACAAVRAFVDAWRIRLYAADPKPGENKTTENKFLADFDLQYYLRRLAFMSRRINELSLCDPKALDLFTAWATSCGLGDAVDDKWNDADFKKEFRGELRALKEEVNTQVALLRRLLETLPAQPAFVQCIAAMKLRWRDHLVPVLEKSGAARIEKAERMLDAAGADQRAAIENTVRKVQRHFRAARRRLHPARWSGRRQLAALSGGETAAQACIDFYFAQFHLYDLVLFPVQYGTGATEAGEVEIFRISPEDATAIFSERESNRRKLAGTVLMNFGAFLDERWRKNDILWGRLDGAERLIMAVMPLIQDGDEKIRQKLIRQAQTAILADELHLGKVQEMRCLLVQCLVHEAEKLGGNPDEEVLRGLLDDVSKRLNEQKQQLPATLHTVFDACLREPEHLWEYFNTAYKVDRRYDAQNAVRLMARATNVAARMLEGLAEQYKFTNKRMVWITRFAAIFWGLVELAMPQSMGNLLGRHWFKLLYLAALLCILGGAFIGPQQVSTFGWTALAIILGVHTLVTVVGDVLSGASRKIFARAMVYLFGLLLIGLLSGWLWALFVTLYNKATGKELDGPEVWAAVGGHVISLGTLLVVPAGIAFVCYIACIAAEGVAHWLPGRVRALRSKYRVFDRFCQRMTRFFGASGARPASGQ